MTIPVAARGGPRSALRAALAVLAGQLYVGWSNDYVDRRRDAAARRVDKPIVSGNIDPADVAAAAVAALVVAVPMSLACGRSAGVRHLTAIAAASAYNLGVKATAFSWAPYVCSFSQVPSFILLSTEPRRAASIPTTAGAGLIAAGAHFAQALRDIDNDRALGGGGLPARIGVSRSALAASTLTAAGVLVTSVAHGNRPSESRARTRLRRAARAFSIGVGLSLSVSIKVAAQHGQDRLAFRLAQATALAATPAFLANETD